MFILLFCVVSVYGKELYEGEDCVKIDIKGTCTRLSQCPTALDDLRHKKLPQLCSYNSSIPIVCCDDIIYSTIQPPLTTPVKELLGQQESSEPIPSSTTVPKTGPVSWDKCLKYQELVYPHVEDVHGQVLKQNRCQHDAEALTVGGSIAGRYEFSHVVRLGTTQEDGSIQWLRNCEGALISELFVLSSAHCSNSREGAVTHVLFGVESFSSHIVRSILPHPDYKVLNRRNDIALLELLEPVPLDQFRVPACLPVGDMENRRATYAGWGFLFHADSQALQKIRVIKVPASECAGTLPPRLMKQVLDGSQECYVDRTNSTCQVICPHSSVVESVQKENRRGVTGIDGILQVESKEIRCMHIVTGVASFTARGCVGSEFGVYTSVGVYVPWIESIVWPPASRTEV